jgi:hydroxyacylglutathione hydrolase
MKLEIVQIACLSDNYCVLLHDPQLGDTAAIDAPDANAIKSAVSARGWRLTHLFVTHHHQDHTGGNLALKSCYGCRIFGPEAEADRIPGIDVSLTEKSSLSFANHPIRIIETPGHTAGHITYYWPDDALAFTGDTLFVLGCGRLFEGDAQTMHQSLQKLVALPDNTTVYCGHEYTLANAKFAATVEPENKDLAARYATIQQQRTAGEATVPTTIALEKATNPFLRTKSASIRARLGMEHADDWHVFQRLRDLKNKA